MTDEDREAGAWVREHFADGEHTLVGALQALQHRFGYLPKEGMREVARALALPPARVFGVATFYNQFRFVPPGRHAIRVCLGTACHIKQGELVLDQWERRLGIDVGGVTPDREYSLDRVDCVGCCAMAPVTVIGDDVMGGMSVTRVDGLLLTHRIEKEKAARAKKEPA
jgi:NADH-quinone oxidoreductase subunit E